MNQPITLSPFDLETMLARAAKKGAEEAIAGMVLYTYEDAAKCLGVCYNTLKKRITEGKLKPIDGRISGAELQRYLAIASQPARRQ